MRAILTVLIVACFVSVTRAQEGPAPEAGGLDGLVQQLRQAPGDEALRARIIKLALKSQPKTPEDAKRHMGRAKAFVELATGPADYGKVVAELDEALSAAPWLASAYYNKGLSLEKMKQYPAAQAAFKDYLLAAPDAANAEAIQERIYKLEAMGEKASSALSPGETVSKEEANSWDFATTGLTDIRETVREGGFKTYHGKDAFYMETDIPGQVVHGIAISGFTSRTYYSKEKDGVYYLGMEMEISGKTSETTYDPPMMYHPIPFVKGAKWSYKGVSVTGSAGTTTTTSTESESEVTGEERVTVPAGTFDSLVVTQTSRSTSRTPMGAKIYTNTGEATVMYWVVPGLGDVKVITNSKVIEAGGERWSDEQNAKYSKPMVRTLNAYKVNRAPWVWDAAPPKPLSAEAAAPPAPVQPEVSDVERQKPDLEKEKIDLLLQKLDLQKLKQQAVEHPKGQ